MLLKSYWLIIVMAATMFLVTGDGVAAKEKPGAKAKYVFLFVGDGMGIAQRNAAELFLGKQKGVNRPENTKLVMNTFPAQGMNTTYDLSRRDPGFRIDCHGDGLRPENQVRCHWDGPGREGHLREHH